MSKFEAGQYVFKIEHGCKMIDGELAEYSYVLKHRIIKDNGNENYDVQAGNGEISNLNGNALYSSRSEGVSVRAIADREKFAKENKELKKELNQQVAAGALLKISHNELEKQVKRYEKALDYTCSLLAHRDCDWICLSCEKECHKSIEDKKKCIRANALENGVNW